MFHTYFQKMTEQLALEYNCEPADFRRNESILTESVIQEGRRKYIPGPYYFHMATAGQNAVLTANVQLHPALREYMQREKQGHALFSVPNLLHLEEILRPFGFTLTPTHHMFLPCKNTEPALSEPVRWFFDEEIDRFYGDARFPNAICPERLPERPDRIAVCAYDGDTIMGMAGCSEDAPHWQQIGIDVLPEYRSRGIGSYLVTLLKNAVLARGDIPFYGADLGNYHSWNIALRSGFSPAWVEIGAKPISLKDESSMK